MMKLLNELLLAEKLYWFVAAPLGDTFHPSSPSPCLRHLSWIKLIAHPKEAVQNDYRYTASSSQGFVKFVKKDSGSPDDHLA